jgi:hypothetical protein
MRGKVIRWGGSGNISQRSRTNMVSVLFIWSTSFGRSYLTLSQFPLLVLHDIFSYLRSDPSRSRVMKTIFKRLVRFEDEEGTIRFGEAPEDIDALLGKSVSIYEGDQPWELIQGNEQAEISRVRGQVHLVEQDTDMQTTASQSLAFCAYNLWHRSELQNPFV